MITQDVVSKDAKLSNSYERSYLLYSGKDLSP